MNNKVLIICYSHLKQEPRVLMECAALRHKYELTVAGFSGLNDPKIKFLKITGAKPKPLFRFHLNFPKLLRVPFSFANRIYFKLTGVEASYSPSDYGIIRATKYSLIICHHPATLALAFELQRFMKCKVIFNAHEIYSLEFEDDPQWMADQSTQIESVLQRYLKRCEAVFTVNDEISEFYRKRYQCRAVTVKNSKPLSKIEPTPVQSPVRVIHHGGAMRQRKLEQMADAVIELKGRYQLTFMLVETDKKYLEELRSKYEPHGVVFVPAVPYEQIVEEINKYDIGLYILPGGNINHELALPNKLFEYLQAKLAIVCTPNVAMKNIVVNNGIGVVSAGYSTKDMINTLDSLSLEQIRSYKKATLEVSSVLSAEVDERTIATNVDLILN